MPWIAANHRTEGAVSMSAESKHCRPTRGMSIDFCVHRYFATAIDTVIRGKGQPIEAPIVEKISDIPASSLMRR